jgi:hypothetical protein
MSPGVTLVVAGRDNPLNIDPDVSFFKTLYKRHTNFSSVIDKLTLQTRPANNGTSTTRVEVKGDLLSYMYISNDWGNTTESVPRKWSRVIDKVELFIGNQLIDTQYYDYSAKIATEVQAPTLSKSIKGSSGSEYSYFYPLKFFFCEHWASSIPLISLNYHDVEIVIHWGDHIYINNILEPYLAEVEQYRNQNISYTDLLEDINLYQNVSNTDVYTNVQDNITIYQGVVIPPVDDYTDVKDDIAIYQAIDTNDYANIKNDILVYQTYGFTDVYSNLSTDVTNYQGVTIPSTGQYIDFQSNISLYQAATTDVERINDASNVVGGFSNLIPEPILTDDRTYYVAVKQVLGNYKYYINGELQANLTFRRGSTYIFNLSNGDTYTNHPLRFSETPDGTHGGGGIYIEGVTLDPLTKTVTIVVSETSPDTLYYFCTIHSGMGSMITVMDERVVPTYQSLTDGYIIYDNLTDSSGSFLASDALNVFITSLNSSEKITASTDVISDFNNLSVYPSNILTQNVITGFLTYDGTEDTALDYAPTNSLTAFMDTRVIEERSNLAANLVTDHGAITDTGNTLTFATSTGFLTYTTTTPSATLVDSITGFDASDQLSTNMGIYNNVIRIDAAQTLSASWAITADSSAPYSNTFTIDGTTGYITYESVVDSYGSFEGSDLLNNVMTEFHNYERSNIAQDVIDSHLLATLDSNVVSKTDLEGFIVYQDLTDTVGHFTASELLNTVMGSGHHAIRLAASSNVLNSYATLNPLMSNVLTRNEETGFLIYNGTLTDTDANPPNYPASDALIVDVSANRITNRESNSSNVINNYPDVPTIIAPAPTRDPVDYFITFNGNDEDTNAAYPSGNALINYITQVKNNYESSDFELMGRFIYLDKDERRYMSERSADYIITQTQRIPAPNKKDVELNLNHPISFIASTASNFNASNKMLLELNGEPVGDPKPAVPHYKQVSTYYHTTYGSNQYTTMMYPFCLDASNKEHTGSLNFSRLDSARLTLDQAINGDIYAVNYNILRISNGTAGLLYA